jgi:competence protein ComEA
MERVVALAGLAVVAAIGLVYVWISADVPEPQPTAVVQVGTSSNGSILVHVSGAVVSPGVVVVPADSRVADVVAAAGGVSPVAVLEAINLAAVVHDGEQIIVPTATSASAVASDGRIPINSADAATLETLPGVGPVLAERIVAFRTQNGAFGSVEDLLDVPGIGESKLASLRESVRVP